MKLCNNCRHLGKQKKIHSYSCLNPKSKRKGIPFAHRSTRKACDLYAGRNLPVVFSLPEGARTIEDYFDRHKGEEIWVIGSGYTLDDFPDDFFDDKISIAVSYTFTAFPNCTYIMSSHTDCPDWVVENRPEFLKKYILAAFPTWSEDIVWPDRYGNTPIWMNIIHPSKPPKSVEQVIEDAKRQVKPIMEKQPIIYQSLWSTAHIAAIVAILLGAKKITLVGCSTKTLRFQSQSRKGLMRSLCRDREWSVEEQSGELPVQRLWRRGVSLLAELYKPYGIEIRKYYYKTGYEEVEIGEKGYEESGA